MPILRRAVAVAACLSMFALVGCGSPAAPAVDDAFNQWYAQQSSVLGAEGGAAGGSEPGIVNLADIAASDYTITSICHGVDAAHIAISIRDELVAEFDLECGGSSQLSASLPRGDLLVEVTGAADTWWWVGLSAADAG